MEGFELSRKSAIAQIRYAIPRSSSTVKFGLLGFARCNVEMIRCQFDVRLSTINQRLPARWCSSTGSRPLATAAWSAQSRIEASAIAVTTGLDLFLARDLIARKLNGQRKNLARLRASDLRAFDALRGELDKTEAIEQVRGVEARAAALYWSAWSSVSVRWRGRDLSRIPKRWARYDSRASVLTGAPRASTQPVNSLLNYLYSLLEAESRLALLAHGLDPTLGVLHADQRNRDSFALDVIEPLRPDVDAFILDLLEDRAFTSRDFVELPNGVCRLCAPLTHDLALTLPHWRALMQPIVARLAQTFREALVN